jgi:hypothetical protein
MMVVGSARGRVAPICAFVLFIASACSGRAAASPVPVINVYATSAARPWLESFYACGETAAAIALSDPQSADIEVRLGEPADLRFPAFEIGEENILVVVHPLDAVGALDRFQVQRLFAGEVINWSDLGGADLPVQVWTYAAGEDVQEYFDGVVMDGRPITSLARLAASSQAMSDAVGASPGAVGFLPERWKAGNTREVLQLPSLPVLVITRAEPSGIAKQLLGCVQARSNGSP